MTGSGGHIHSHTVLLAATAVVLTLVGGCQRAAQVGTEVAHGVHPVPVPVPKVGVPSGLPKPGHPDLPAVGVPAVVPPAGPLDQLLTRFANGSQEERVVKFAACTAMRKSTSSQRTTDQWRSQIYAAAPELAAGNLRRAVVDKAVDRVASALSATRDYGATYTRLCKF